MNALELRLRTSRWRGAAPLTAFAACLLATSLVAAAEATMTEQQRVEAIRRLHWFPAATYKLPISKSTLALPDGYQVLLGEDARRMITLSGDPADSSVEAIVFSPHFDDEIIFQSINDGYVPLDDWSDVNPDTMINSIRDNTEEANQYRKRQGIRQIHVVGWLQEPTLDRQASTVYWAIEGINDGSLALISLIHT
jgi:uncharacterized membrane-anchored protein